MKIEGREGKRGREKPKESLCIFPVLVLIVSTFCLKELLCNRNHGMAMLIQEDGIR